VLVTRYGFSRVVLHQHTKTPLLNETEGVTLWLYPCELRCATQRIESRGWWFAFRQEPGPLAFFKQKFNSLVRNVVIVFEATVTFYARPGDRG
jgi:hypothetical protein